MSDLNQCAACGYICDARETVCVRCNTPFDGRPPAPPEPRAPWPTPPPAAPIQRHPNANRGLVIGAALVAATVAVLVALYFVFVKPEFDKRGSRESLKSLLLAQPDFIADCEGHEGDFSYQGQMARKGDRFFFQVRLPRSLLLGVGRSGMTAINAIMSPDNTVRIVIPEATAYVDVPRNSPNFPKGDPIKDILKSLDESGCEIREFGKSSVADVETRLFCVSDRDGKRRDAFIDVAPSLKNLIVKVDFNDDWTPYEGALKYTLTNVKFDVDDELFRVPVTYTKISQ